MWYIDTLSAGKYRIRCPMYERLVPWLDMCWVLPRRQMQLLHHCKWNMCWKLLILNNYSITTIAFWISDIKVILHQFWVKKFFPWKFNLEYGCTFTKLFMHVSSRNMFPTARNLHVLSDQSVHFTHAYCCVSKLSKFGAYLYSCVHNNTFLSLRNAP